MAKKNRYDIIFMDHMMPEMDGIEAVEHIRNECGKDGRDAIIIALTANALSGTREIFLSNGFNDFLAKPFEKKQLYDILDKWLRKQLRRKENG